MEYQHELDRVSTVRMMEAAKSRFNCAFSQRITKMVRGCACFVYKTKLWAKLPICRSELTFSSGVVSELTFSALGLPPMYLVAV
jgi:hypothetical protein